MAACSLDFRISLNWDHPQLGGASWLVEGPNIWEIFESLSITLGCKNFFLLKMIINNILFNQNAVSSCCERMEGSERTKERTGYLKIRKQNWERFGATPFVGCCLSEEHLSSDQFTLHISFMGSYCWWTKSCTTKHDDYPIIYRVSTIQVVQDFFHQQYYPVL